MVDHAVDRTPLDPDRDGVQHQAEEPSGIRDRAELIVVEVARPVEDAPATAVRAEDRRAVHALQDVRERPARRVGQVEDHASPTSRSTSSRPSRESPPPSSAAPSANGFRRFHVSPAIRTPSAWKTSAGQVSTPKRLDALEREQEADAIACLDCVEVRGRRHLDRAPGVLGKRPMERRDERERLAK